MEGKTPFGAVIMGVLLLSLVLSQTQVEAKSCCKTTASRNCYNICRATGKVSQKNCAALCISCKIFEGITVCPPDYPKTSLESSAEIQVEAKPKSCCPGTLQRNCYNLCRVGGKITSETCAKTCGCKHVDGRVCPPGWQSDILGNSGINEYCKLGCASSVCEAISTLQISDAGEEVVNGAVEQCTEACSAFCTKGSLEIA